MPGWDEIADARTHARLTAVCLFLPDKTAYDVDPHRRTASVAIQPRTPCAFFAARCFGTAGQCNTRTGGSDPGAFL